MALAMEQRWARLLRAPSSCRRSANEAAEAAHRPRLVMAPRTKRAKGGDARVSRQMPWIFRNEVVNVPELIQHGKTSLLVDVENSEGRELGVAMCTLARSGGINILGRMLTDNVAVHIDRSFLQGRLQRALEHRRRCFGDATSYRLVNAEGDLLPGVLCDRYGDTLCLQFTALAAEELLREELLAALEDLLSPKAIILRYDVREDRQLEQAHVRPPELARGASPGLLEVETASGFVFTADPLEEGWTSGAFFAERSLRKLLAEALRSSPEGQSSAVGERKGKAKGQPPVPQVLSLFGESSGIFAAWKGAKVTCALHKGEGEKVARAARELLARRNGCEEHVTYFSLGTEPRLDELGTCRGTFDVALLARFPNCRRRGLVKRFPGRRGSELWQIGGRREAVYSLDRFGRCSLCPQRASPGGVPQPNHVRRQVDAMYQHGRVVRWPPSTRGAPLSTCWA
ncbi:unnamed protein product [Durusdinium trenchii]|uniref:RlmI-like PUA domain-containing protein n=1 Tax=Durusdinium trenchii TaxID=1381693 RepID=A0ABP0JC64_9DINO